MAKGVVGASLIRERGVKYESHKDHRMKKKSLTVIHISERDWQNQVIQLAKLYKWKVHAERPARTKHGWKTPIQGDVGFPDLVLVRGDRLIFAELKTQKGQLSQEQENWYIALSSVAYEREEHIQVEVWRPKDFEEVQKILK